MNEKETDELYNYYNLTRKSYLDGYRQSDSVIDLIKVIYFVITLKQQLIISSISILIVFISQFFTRYINSKNIDNLDERYASDKCLCFEIKYYKFYRFIINVCNVFSNVLFIAVIILGIFE